MATASVVFVEWLIFGVLALLLVPANSYWGFEIAAFVSILVAGIVVGYVFGGKMIEESSRMRSIGKIAVLLAVWTIFVSMMMYGSAGHYMLSLMKDCRVVFRRVRGQRVIGSILKQWC